MLDPSDIRLMDLLQKDAHLTAQELGDALNMSASQAGRRKQRLEANDYITGYRAVISPKRLGLSVQAFVQISMTGHSSDISRSFHNLVQSQREVINVWTLTGEADYLLQVYCENLEELNRLVHEIFLPHQAVARVQTKIVMEQIKRDAALPV